MRGCEIKKLQWEALTSTYGKLIAEPLKKGFATTVGNSLRRILLSSIKGAAITSIKIDGLFHEFTTIKGIVEDPVDFILNIKDIVFKYEGDEKEVLFLERGKGKITAGMIKTQGNVTIINPEHYLAMVSDGKIKMEMELETGVGYLSADERERERKIGTIPIDANFSPIKRVNFSVEDVRIGRVANYERLIFEITTNGAISPKEAISKASSILSDYIAVFISGEPFLIEEKPPEKISEEKKKLKEIVNTNIDELEISVRASNCLRMAGIIRIGDVVKMSEEELLKMKNFGRKSLVEIKEKLADYNLTLGMNEVGEFLEPLSEEEIMVVQEEIKRSQKKLEKEEEIMVVQEEIKRSQKKLEKDEAQEEIS